MTLAVLCRIAVWRAKLIVKKRSFEDKIEKTEMVNIIYLFKKFVPFKKL